MNAPACPAVVHVVERPTEASAEFDRSIARVGLQPDVVETVYGAMARLARPGDVPVRAVLVCVDALEAAELEFFTLAARRYPDVPLYVYGQSVEGQRRQRALALGAQLEVTADRLGSALGALVHRGGVEVSPEPVHAAVEDADASSEPTEETTPAEEPVTSDGEVPQALVAGSLEDPTPSEASAASQTRPTDPSGVPTPWQPATGRPRRIPPGAKGRPPRNEGADVAADRRSTPSPDRPMPKPLLSRQEVDALLAEPKPTEQRETHDDEPA